MIVKPLAIALLLLLAAEGSVSAQTPPSAQTIAAYTGLHKAAHEDDLQMLQRLLAAGADPNVRDDYQRTPAHVAAYASNEEALRVLAEAGAKIDALEAQAYDIVTIAGVANDIPMLKAALEVGADPGQITSPYEGTALIAAAHLGHKEVVRILAEAGAPLDHINNLNWTALMEAVVLGDGGPDHIACVEILLEHGADPTLADRSGVTPLEHAKSRGFAEMVTLLEQAN